MKHYKVVWLSAALGTLLSLGMSNTATSETLGRDAHKSTTTSSTARVDAQLARLAKHARGSVGIIGFDLDGGPVASLNADESFPMASTVKISVAGKILDLVKEGELSLEQMIEVKPEDYVLSEIIADRIIHPGLAMSVANLIELMITDSDNTATDTLVALAGGPKVVTQWLHTKGIQDQRMDRNINTLLRDYYNLPAQGLLSEIIPAMIKKNPELVAQQAKSNPVFDSAPQDTSTPAAMGKLLSAIANNSALTPEHSKFLLGVLTRTRSGKSRIKSLLPPGTTVAHKTGTLGGVSNDVGLITLPNGHRIVVVVFIKETNASFETRDHTIAEISRTLYDYFLLLDQ